MKRCPYCAEQIEDDVVICPYCRSDVTVDPNAPMESRGPAEFRGPAAPESIPSTPERTAPQVGEGALRFSHSGERYILGYGAGFFGIWDRNQPGGPVLRFDRTDQGWNEAWNRFSGMEKRFVEVPQTGPPPDARASAAEYRPMRTLGAWVAGLVGLTAFLFLATMILRGVEISRLRDLDAGVRPLDQVQGVRRAVTNIAPFTGLVILAAAVVWLIWQYRGHANLRALGAADLRFTPGWGVGWWLIPFAFFVMPPQTVSELWRASEPGAGSLDWKRKGLTPLVPAWWTACLARFPLLSFAAAAAPSQGASAHQVIRQEWFAMGSDVVTIAGAVLAVLLVRQITGRQERKRSRMAAYGSAVAAAAG